MLKLLPFSCWCCCQLLGGGSIRPKTQSFRPDSGLESDCDFLRPQNEPGAPETLAQTNSRHNSWILGDLIKGGFFPNVPHSLYPVFALHC
jgi:hypothetical protein